MKIRMKNDGTDYIELIWSINAMITMFDDHIARPVNHSVILRHDVDHDIDHALKFAHVEAEAGIQATYFLLHTESYFDYSWEFADKCKELYKLGHSIGLHNNIITAWIKNGRKSIRDIITKPLDFLRDLGIPIKGTSSHGDPFCYAYNYVNYEIWEECPIERKNKDLKFEKFSLKDFGLDYEAYFLKRDGYVSDSGGRWRGAITMYQKDQHSRFTIEQNDADSIHIKKFIEVFNKIEGSILQLLVHPIWWKIE